MTALQRFPGNGSYTSIMPIPSNTMMNMSQMNMSSFSNAPSHFLPDSKNQVDTNEKEEPKEPKESEIAPSKKEAEEDKKSEHENQDEKNKKEAEKEDVKDEDSEEELFNQKENKENEAKKEDKNYESLSSIDEEEADIVRKIFNKF